METRANFILIGAFTLAAILGALGFFIWLASVQIDRQYATYGILFDDVSGLSPSGDVLFNGISVGKVIDLRIDERDPSKVFATVEIDATTPVRINTVAQLQSQGVTGVSYIALAGGTPGAPMLVATDREVPIIQSRRSTVQTLVEDAPDLLAEATRLLQQFQALTGPQNQEYVSNILRNLDASSARLDQALTDFSTITGTVSDATAEIGLFTRRLEGIGAAVTTTLGQADIALATAERAFAAAETTLTGSQTAIDSAAGAFDAAQLVLAQQLPALLRELTTTVAQANGAIADLQARSGRALDGFGQTAGLLNLRLTELEQTLLDASTAFAAVTEASDSFDTLVDGDGTLLVAETRAVMAQARGAVGAIETVVQQDVPVIVADIRSAVAVAATAVDRVAGDVTGLTGRFAPLATETEQALLSATALFGRAQTSLVALDAALTGAQTAMGAAETALGAAETTFDAATGVISNDLGPVFDDIRAASGRIGAAVEDVTRDVPAIAADLRALIARADAVVAQVQGAVAATAPGIGEFASSGLPELTRLGTEARNLVNSLDSLVRRIERDPARFLLDNRVPEYRR